MNLLANEEFNKIVADANLLNEVRELAKTHWAMPFLLADKVCRLLLGNTYRQRPVISSHYAVECDRRYE